MTFKARLVQAIFARSRFSYITTRWLVDGLFRRLPLYLLLLSCMLLNCRDKEHVLTEQNIISFQLKTISAVVSIDQSANLITVGVPYGILIQNVAAVIQASEGATVVPAAYIPQDFTKAVYYTITGIGGDRKVYKVICTYLAQTPPEISAISADTVQAGDTLVIAGRHFGSFALALSTFVKDMRSGKETPIPFQLADSLHIRLLLPSSLTASDYYLMVVKDKVSTASKNTVNIRIHSPEITAIRKVNLRQSDTLWIAGNFIQTGVYRYSVLLTNQAALQFSPVVSLDGKLGVIPGSLTVPDSYQIQILNTSERSVSAQFKQKIRIYDDRLPFVHGISEAKASYLAGETIRLTTSNFTVLNARFYSVRLIGSNTQYTQNAIFNTQSNILNLTIPTEISKGSYQISIDLLDNAGRPVYEIGMDDLILIQ